MIGHQQIVDYRKKGKRPNSVFIEYGREPKKSKYWFDEVEKQLEHGFHAVVYVKKEERPDMRFLFGLQTHVFPKDELDDDAISFLEHVAKYKPSKLIASDSQTMMIFEKGVWNASAY